jgi:hypothetical protein
LAEVSASFVVTLAFDRHFESPTLPSLFFVISVILYRAPCTRSGGPLALLHSHFATIIHAEVSAGFLLLLCASPTTIKNKNIEAGATTRS